MKPSSAKAKGRIFQQWVRDKLYKAFSVLEDGDIRSTSMGAGGMDIQLSPAAGKLIPWSIECKSNKAIAVYKFYDQAKENANKKHEAVVFMKMNGRKPLAMVDAEHFIKMQQKLMEKGKCLKKGTLH